MINVTNFLHLSPDSPRRDSFQQGGTSCAFPEHPLGYGGVTKATRKLELRLKKGTPLRPARNKHRSIQDKIADPRQWNLQAS
jgi:hypothetical protein